MMKLYNREKETVLLKKIEQKSFETAQMTFVVGRRRIGKTAIVAEVKRNANNINVRVLQNKAANLVKQLANYQIEYHALSMNDM